MDSDDEKYVYDPREDSYLMQKYVEKYARGIVLDVGTGSGIQALTAAKKAEFVIGTDINKFAVVTSRLDAQIYKVSNVTFEVSDLLAIVGSRFFDIKKRKWINVNNADRANFFDLIIFNAPYLPDEGSIKDDSLFGGKRGIETTLRFLDQAVNHLKDDGNILLTCSSLASPEIIQQTIRNYMLSFEELERIHVFFEDVFVYRIYKSKILQTLNSKGISRLQFFTQGKRGMIFTGIYRRMKIAVKIKKPESTAEYSIENEGKFLKLLNKKNIGPKLLFFDKDFLAYRFVEGVFIIEYLSNCTKKEEKVVIKKLLNQMYALDMLKITKFEMNHPQKHILITKDKEPILIDFERARFREDSKNVTQFCDFLLSLQCEKVKPPLNLDRKKMITLCRRYKEGYSKKSFEEITNYVMSSI